MPEEQSTKVEKEKLIGKKESENGFFDQVNQNYSKRFDEAEYFTKRLFNMCSDLNSECLRSCLNTVQRFVEMEKKHQADSRYGIQQTRY